MKTRYGLHLVWMESKWLDGELWHIRGNDEGATLMVDREKAVEAFLDLAAKIIKAAQRAERTKRYLERKRA